MKYLHSGYILLCNKADHAKDGRVNAHGLFDLFVVEDFPSQMSGHCIVGFGTPYERRQYKGHLEVEDPTGRTVFTADFDANDTEDLLRGHAIVPVDLWLHVEGCYTIRCALYNWKNENVWEVSRQLWAMKTGSAEESAAQDAGAEVSP